LSTMRTPLGRSTQSVHPCSGLGRSRLCKYTVKATVVNTGSVAGGEVVQVYLSLPASASTLGAAQPPKRLVDFARVELAPGSRKDVTMVVDPSGSNHPFSVWSTTNRAWMTPSGSYVSWVGNSSSPGNLVSAGSFTK
jgi:beta-glucosidase